MAARRAVAARSPKFERETIDRLARIETKADISFSAASTALATHVKRDDERFDALAEQIEHSRSWLIDWIRPIVTGAGAAGLVILMNHCR